MAQYIYDGTLQHDAFSDEAIYAIVVQLWKHPYIDKVLKPVVSPEDFKSVFIPQVRPVRIYSIPPWEMNHLPWEINQQAYNLIRITRLNVTSHSQPLINAQHPITSNKLLVNNNK
jgi:hypothetical protein